MKRESSRSKAPAAAPETAQQLVVVGKVGGQSVTVPQLSPRSQAAAAAVEQYKGYMNTIDSEDVKLFINSVLVEVKQQLNAVKREVDGITDPLVNIRRDALTAKQNAENAFAPLITHLETAERMLKGEILRWEQLVERKRLQAQAEAQRRADEEKRRLEEEARLEAEKAAREDLERRERAAQLELEGKKAEAETERFRADVRLEAASEKVEAILEDAERTSESAIVNTTSVKMAGTSVTGKWVAEVVDVMDVLRGIAELGPARSTHPTPLAPSTPADAVRVKHNGRLIPLPLFKGDPSEIEGIEINLPWFNDQARRMQDTFSYRGMKAEFVQDLRVRA